MLLIFLILDRRLGRRNSRRLFVLVHKLLSFLIDESVAIMWRAMARMFECSCALKISVSGAGKKRKFRHYNLDEVRQCAGSVLSIMPHCHRFPSFGVIVITR